MMARPSLSSWAYFCSVDDSDREANAIGFSPSASLWERTAPTPYGEASQDKITSFCGS